MSARKFKRQDSGSLGSENDRATPKSRLINPGPVNAFLPDGCTRSADAAESGGVQQEFASRPGHVLPGQRRVDDVRARVAFESADREHAERESGTQRADAGHRPGRASACSARGSFPSKPEDRSSPAPPDYAAFVEIRTASVSTAVPRRDKARDQRRGNRRQQTAARKSEIAEIEPQRIALIVDRVAPGVGRLHQASAVAIQRAHRQGVVIRESLIGAIRHQLPRGNPRRGSAEQKVVAECVGSQQAPPQ